MASVQESGVRIILYDWLMTCALKLDLRPTPLTTLMGETNNKLISFKLRLLMIFGVIIIPNS